MDSPYWIWSQAAGWETSKKVGVASPCLFPLIRDRSLMVVLTGRDWLAQHSQLTFIMYIPFTFHLSL